MPPNTTPLISILIPTTGRNDIARLAVQSVLEQTFQDFEVIVCDGGQSDAVRQTVLSAADERVRYVRPPIDAGPYSPFNYAYYASKGKYVLWLDDDNFLLPFALDLFATAIKKKQPDIITGSHVYYYDDQHPNLYLRNSLGVLPFTKEEYLVEPREVLQTIFAFGRRGPGTRCPRLHMSTTMIKREIVEQLRAKLGYVVLEYVPNIHSTIPSLLAFSKTCFFVDYPVAIVGRLGISMSQGWSTEAKKRFKKIPYTPQATPFKGYTKINGLLDNFLALKNLLPDRLQSIKIDYERFMELHIGELAYLDMRPSEYLPTWSEVFKYIKSKPKHTRSPLWRVAWKALVFSLLLYPLRRLRLHRLWRKLMYVRAKQRAKKVSPKEQITSTREFAIPLEKHFGINSVETLAKHIKDIFWQEMGLDFTYQHSSDK